MTADGRTAQGLPASYVDTVNHMLFKVLPVFHDPKCCACLDIGAWMGKVLFLYLVRKHEIDCKYQVVDFGS